MGNNEAFATFETMVIRLYDLGKLDLETLDAIAENWRGTDIDSGGQQYLEAKDGKGLEEIVIDLVDPGWILHEDDEDALWDKFAEIKESRWEW